SLEPEEPEDDSGWYEQPEESREVSAYAPRSDNRDRDDYDDADAADDEDYDSAESSAESAAAPPYAGGSRLHRDQRHFTDPFDDPRAPRALRGPATSRGGGHEDEENRPGYRPMNGPSYQPNQRRQDSSYSRDYDDEASSALASYDSREMDYQRGRRDGP